MKNLTLFFVATFCFVNSVFGQKLTAADTARVREEVLDAGYASREQIDSLLDFEVKQWDIWLKLVQRQIADSEWDEAQQSVEKTLEYAPADEREKALVAIAFWCTDAADARVDLARKYADRALQTQPNLWSAFFVKGYAGLVDSTFSDVDIHLKKAIDLLPADQEALKPNLMLLYMVGLHKNNKSDQALQLATAEIKKGGDDAAFELYVFRASVYDDLKKGDETINDYQKAFEITSEWEFLKKKIEAQEKYKGWQAAIDEAVRLETAAVTFRGFSHSITKSANLPPTTAIKLGKGMKLTYSVDNMQILTLKIEEISPKKVVFTYQLDELDPLKIEISGDALTKANGMMSYSMTNITETKFDKDTSIFVFSKNTYQNLMKSTSENPTTVLWEGLSSGLPFYTIPEDEREAHTKELIIKLFGKWTRLEVDQYTDGDETWISILKGDFPLLLHANQSVGAGPNVRLIQID